MNKNLLAVTPVVSTMVTIKNESKLEKYVPSLTNKQVTDGSSTVE